jgi:HlyD family secretion protein
MAAAQTAEKSATPPWEAKKAPNRRGLLRRVVIWTAVTGVVALIVYGLIPKPVEVELGTVKRGSLTVSVSEEGRTRIRNRYVVSAPVAGYMRRVPFKPGAELKAGETLITTIEPALAPLLDARAKSEAEARVQAAEASRQRAEEAVALAKTAAEFAQRNWERAKGTEASIAAADRDNLERDALMRQREVRSAEFALQVAEYELSQAKAALIQMQSPSGGTTIEIRSPVSGRILKVMQESATVVTPGMAIVEVGDPNDLEIEAEILSRDAVAIKPGADVSIEQWGGDKPLPGRVRLVEPAAFTKISALGVEEQRVIVVIDLETTSEEAKALGDRYRVEVRVAVWHEDHVLLVPAGGLFREGSEWKTFLFERGKARKATVETGRTNGQWTQVLGGLKEGDKVLMHPPDSVKDGTTVQERQTPGS